MSLSGRGGMYDTAWILYDREFRCLWEAGRPSDER